ncbi:helix-turn-helix transcriptional regulator [Actinospica durhamensis]|uniref:Helix-turn-helix transcriptional regulator n=1 Tax=Actinospica durhamensis TaxID=1508375 RepID=A0A941EKG4_9ACTN|nr:helix-turn-helix transcriptional regulator [Actinospica durhamensis]MBR7832495.1 helix-turn-helix transcriptional regulator [Actinospica durhamensis]
MPAIATGPMNEAVRVNLRRIREEQGVSLRDLSKRLEELGHSLLSSGIGRIEQGLRRVDVDDLIAISLALSISPLQLLLPPESRPDSRMALTTRTETTTQGAWGWVLGRPVPLISGLGPWAFEHIELPRDVITEAEKSLEKLWDVIERVKSMSRYIGRNAQMYEAALERQVQAVESFVAAEADVQQRRDLFGFPSGVSSDDSGRHAIQRAVDQARELLQEARPLLVELHAMAELSHREDDDGQS